MTPLPKLVEPGDLMSNLDAHPIAIVDLCRPNVYSAMHIPGAVHMRYAELVAKRGLIGGLRPSSVQLEFLFSRLGLTSRSHVVAYDDEGGGAAGRLIWTLETLGHANWSFLNGGLQAWTNENLPVSTDLPSPIPSSYSAAPQQGRWPAALADADYIMSRLGEPDFVCLDTRTAAEYTGADRRASRAGHIPGARHMDWAETIDREANFRLKPALQLLGRLRERGVTVDKEVVVYCQTHRRSSQGFAMLRTLGFERVRGYHGAWSEWGNRTDTPVKEGPEP